MNKYFQKGDKILKISKNYIIYTEKNLNYILYLGLEI